MDPGHKLPLHNHFDASPVRFAKCIEIIKAFPTPALALRALPQDSNEDAGAICINMDKRKSNSSCDGYATRADFCQAFEIEMSQLYLLAFLLTANHQEAEQCFVRTLEKPPHDKSVFRGWVRSWIRRSLIKIAIHSIFRASRAKPTQYDQWWKEQSETGVAATINAIAQLVPFDRFVFVMSILEGYSTKDCSLLLDCAAEKVIKAKMRGLNELRLLRPNFTGEVAKASSCLGSTA
jgi:DNA-directed RNA polymerase specialized sigma24 family protein